MSFFESLLEGTANAAGNSLGNYQKRQQLLEDDERNQRQAIERADTIDRNRIALSEEQRQALAQRKSQQLQQAEAGGAELTAKQRLQELQGAGVGDVSTLTPEQEAMILQERGLKYGSPLSEIANQRKFAQKEGLYDADAQLQQDYQSTVAALKEQYGRSVSERKLANDERKIDIADKKADGQHNEAMARIAASERRAGSSAKQETLDKLTTRKNAAIRAMAAYQNQGMDASDPVFRSEVEELAEVNRLLASQNEKRDPKPAAKPAPAPAKPQSTKDLVKGGQLKFLGVEKK